MELAKRNDVCAALFARDPLALARALDVSVSPDYPEDVWRSFFESGGLGRLKVPRARPWYEVKRGAETLVRAALRAECPDYELLAYLNAGARVNEVADGEAPVFQLVLEREIPGTPEIMASRTGWRPDNFTLTELAGRVAPAFWLEMAEQASIETLKEKDELGRGLADVFREGDVERAWLQAVYARHGGCDGGS